MPLYRVIVRGRNFRLNTAGKYEKFGFSTTQTVRAPDPVSAARVAVEDFCGSAEYLYLLERSVYSKDDHPVICGEDVAECFNFRELEKPRAALILYKEPCNYGSKREQDNMK